MVCLDQEKTHLSKILEKKMEKSKNLNVKNITNNILENLKNIDCLIIDDFNENIDQKLFYSLFNQSNQIENYILINSIKPIKDFNFNLPDLKSRLQSFLILALIYLQMIFYR